jgi:AAA domain
MPQLPIQPPSVICMGHPGSGKTYSIASLLKSGLETFVISTEPDGIGSLLDACQETEADVSRLHWATCMPTPPGWGALEDMVSTIGTMSFEQIQNIKTGVGKTHTREPAAKFLRTLKNFVCERTGESFGDVTKFDDQRALVLDSLSGLSMIAWMLALGYKPAAHQGEWGVSMNFIEQLLLKMTADRKCFFVMTAHIEKEISEITGLSQIMVSTLGRKLPPKIPKYFSEVVLASRTMKGDTPTFSWATIDPKADLKNRSLPISSNLPPDYAPVVEAYRRRSQIISQLNQGDSTSHKPQTAVQQLVKK